MLFWSRQRGRVEVFPFSRWNLCLQRVILSDILIPRGVIVRNTSLRLHLQYATLTWLLVVGLADCGSTRV